MADRGDGSQTRAQRLSRVKRGAGVFVYNGNAMDHESTPTILLRGRAEPVIDENGMVVLDKAGRQIMHRTGEPVRDERGNAVLGGIPVVKRIKLETLRVGGVAFPTGKPVSVADTSLALKLRSMAHITEVEPGTAKAQSGSVPTRQELMRLARELGVEVDRNMTREQVAAALDAAERSAE